jgi:hypothetical protein
VSITNSSASSTIGQDRGEIKEGIRMSVKMIVVSIVLNVGDDIKVVVYHS